MWRRPRDPFSRGETPKLLPSSSSTSTLSAFRIQLRSYHFTDRTQRFHRSKPAFFVYRRFLLLRHDEEKKKSLRSLLLFRYISIYIYSKDTDGNPASRESFLNEGRGLFGFSRVRMDRLEFKGCARRSPIGVAPTGARLIATHAPLLLRL